MKANDYTMPGRSFVVRELVSAMLAKVHIILLSLSRRDVYVSFFSSVRGTSFEGPNRVMGQTRLLNSNIGRCSYVAPRCTILGASIGRFCSIGPGVSMGLGKHPARGFLSTSPSFYSSANQNGFHLRQESQFVEVAPIKIGNDVWIGANATIADGVQVGDGAIIGAHSLVLQDVLPYQIVAGVPAKVIGSRFGEDVIKSLLQFKWWSKPLEEIVAMKSLFAPFQSEQELLERLDKFSSV